MFNHVCIQLDVLSMHLPEIPLEVWYGVYSITMYDDGP